MSKLIPKVAEKTNVDSVNIGGMCANIIMIYQG